MAKTALGCEPVIGSLTPSKKREYRVTNRLQEGKRPLYAVVFNVVDSRFFNVFAIVGGNRVVMKKKQQEKHFVLIHGACHGAWCWYKVATLLQSAGHKVTALDLSASGINPKQPLDLQSISDYYQPLMTFMDSVSDNKVILVAHSLGGVSISKAMECYPEKISVAVFVTAFIPGPELSPSTIALEYLQRHAPLYGCNDTFDHLPQNLPETYMFGHDMLLSNFYQLCPPEDFNLVKVLGRPARIFSEENLLKEVVLTRERYGSVNRVYIVADEDQAILKDFQLWMTEKNPMHEVKEIKGSDHMVMLSKPHELFACLKEIATDQYQN